MEARNDTNNVQNENRDFPKLETSIHREAVLPCALHLRILMPESALLAQKDINCCCLFLDP